MRFFTKNLGRTLAAAMMMMMSQGMMAGGFFYTNVYARVDVMPDGAGEVYLESGDGVDENTKDPNETMPSVTGPYSEIMFTTRNDTWTDNSTGTDVKYERLWMRVQLTGAEEYAAQGYVFHGFTDKYNEDGIYEDADFYTGLDLKDATGTVVAYNPILRDTVNADMTFVLNVNKDWSITGGTDVTDTKNDEAARDEARDAGFPDVPVQIYAIYAIPDPTGIHGVVAEKVDMNAPVYNAAGQRVGKSYKGLVIKNGKKYIQNNK